MPLLHKKNKCVYFFLRKVNTFVSATKKRAAPSRFQISSAAIPSFVNFAECCILNDVLCTYFLFRGSCIASWLKWPRNRNFSICGQNAIVGYWSVLAAGRRFRRLWPNHNLHALTNLAARHRFQHLRLKCNCWVLVGFGRGTEISALVAKSQSSCTDQFSRETEISAFVAKPRSSCTDQFSREAWISASAAKMQSSHRVRLLPMKRLKKRATSRRGSFQE